MPVRLPPPDRLGAFIHLLGIRFTKGDYGYCECVLEVTEKLLNYVKTLHGGVFSTLADTGMAAALYTTFEEGELPATIEIKVNYLGTVTAGVLSCQSTVIQKSGTIAFVESEIKNDGRLVAKATGTFRVYRPPAAEAG